MMNVNELFRTVNIEARLADVEACSGTFQEIKELVYDNKIVPIVDNAGNVKGICVDYGCKDLIEDNIQGKIFEKRYSCKPIMQWYEAAIKGKMSGKAIEEVEDPCQVNNEAESTNMVDLSDTDESDDSDRDTCYTRNDLPRHLDISVHDLERYLNSLNRSIDEDRLLLDVKSYLRHEYGYFLNGESDISARIENDVVKVRDIAWGRRITN